MLVENTIALAFSILTKFDIKLIFSRVLADFITGSLRELNYNEMF